MANFSLPVLALNAISALTSGLGIWKIASTMPAFAETPGWVIAVGAVAGTSIFQAFINGGWRPYFLGTGGLSAALSGLIASGLSFITAGAGWLMAFDSTGLQADLQAAAVAPHQKVLLTQEQKYIGMATAFDALSAQMSANALKESTTGPACDNDSPATWVNICGPRCRFMNRSSELTADMSTDAQAVAAMMSAIAVKLATGTQEEIDAAYREALTLSRKPEMSRLRTGLHALSNNLTGTIADPETGAMFICRMADTLALVRDAETGLAEVMTLPPRPTRPEPKLEDSLAAATKTSVAMVTGRSDELRAAEKASFWLAFIVEFLLLLTLRRDAKRDLRNGTEPMEPERIAAAGPRKPLPNPDLLRDYLGLIDRYTVNAGRRGRFFAVPYDGEDGDFRSRCLEVVDYLTLPPARATTGAVDMAAILPEWATARASETGQAAQFELYDWPHKLDKWRRFMRRDS